MSHVNRSTPSRGAQALGYGGLIPFVGLALAVWSMPAHQAVAASALLAYCATIVSFLGAIHWGLTMRDATGQSTRMLVWGVFPSLLAWVALLLPVATGMVLLAVILWACFAVDRRTYPRQLELYRHRSAPDRSSLVNDLQLNTDLSQRCVVDSNTLPWSESPSPLVQRRLLERNGGEVARATSVVRYAAGARFDAHTHALGEEILVLEGTLSDALGDYGPGTYLKNPPGSAHAPFSERGCTLFVKLRHLDPQDPERVVVSTRQAPWRQGLVPGLTVLPLWEFGTTHTAMVRWAPGTYFNPHRHYGGEEIFVVEGVFSDEHGNYPQGSWIRSPHLSQHQPFSREGCLILVKTGHLLQ